MNKIGQPIRLHPQWLQFIASEGFIIPIPIALIFIAGYDGFPFTQLIPLLMGLSGIFIIGLIYKYFYITKMMYVITDEQIQSEHGLFSVQRNYVELYRVIDYREDQSFIQMILGIKTITIYSGDRSNPQLKLIGIKNDLDLIKLIRQRVEYNKKRHNIYEFTNNQ